MGALSGLKPEKVFYYFEEICKIPHGSGNVKQISDYLKTFAEERGLFVIQDEVYNIIIKKPASAGYEDQEPIILQGHMDMVAVHKPEYEIDMTTEGLKVGVDGDLVYAEGTSLGGDDGIAVAMSLAILDDDTLAHPPIEVIITTEEEVGMDGARAIDLSCLEGHRLLNLDSEQEGTFLTGCAGGARVTCLFPLKKTTVTGREWTVKICGLLGGHSGAEIDKERGNSNKLAGRLLYDLTEAVPGVSLVDVQGGLADNAIPRETVLRFAAADSEIEHVKELLDAFREDVKAELATKDPGFALEVSHEAVTDKQVYEAFLPAAALVSLPNGVQAMSADVKGLVETSLNLGILKITEAEELHAEFSVRSSVESSRLELMSRLKALTALAGGRNVVTGEYPGWKFRVDSPLREKMIRVYENQYGKKPSIEAIHAGLECGLLSSKIEDLDAVSIGPDMMDIHTTEERLSISSTERVFRFVCNLLAEKD